MRFPNHLRRALALWRELGPAPAARQEWPGPERVLVLVPHPDDDALGCGGTLRLHGLAGGQVSALYLTDGRESALPAPGMSRQALAALRRAETERAAAELGLTQTVFWAQPDQALRAHRHNRSRLARLLDQAQPQRVYVPSPAESHRDHWAANLLLARALQALGAACDCYCYEVWTPGPVNRLVDITTTLPAKQQAIQAHASQLADVDYLTAAQALGRYRALRPPPQFVAPGCWEGFLCLPAKAYRQLVCKLARA